MDRPRLDDLLAAWAAEHRLSESDAFAVRAAVLGSDGSDVEQSVVDDPDWLWRLLRPVTALLEGPPRFDDTFTQLYVRLA